MVKSLENSLDLDLKKTKIIFDSERENLRFDRKYEFSEKNIRKFFFIFGCPNTYQHDYWYRGVRVKRARSKLQNANYM